MSKGFYDNDVKIILESNFKELISEIISSFGNDFFDEIIKYNENFKITGLFLGNFLLRKRTYLADLVLIFLPSLFQV